MKPFDYVTNIFSEREEIEDVSGYVPYITNRAVGGCLDTILFAQEMNMRTDLPKGVQYLFLHNIVPKRKRWSKWIKQNKDDVVHQLSDLYPEYSLAKLEEMVKFLDDETTKRILASKGGRI